MQGTADIVSASVNEEYEMRVEKSKKRTAACILAWMIAVFFLCGAMPHSVADAAATKITVSAKEYNLTVTELPEGVSDRAYAKLHDSSLKAGEFELQLFDGYDALIAMEDALESEGEELDGIDYLAMQAILYQNDGEDDYYPVENRCGITLIVPVPDAMKAQEEKIVITAVDAKGKLQRISSELVSADGVDCLRFDLPASFDVYAFLIKRNGTLTSGAVPTPTPTPKATAAPTKAATAAPTKAATAAPTKAAATAAPTKPATADEKLTPAPQKTPTPVPTKKATPTPAPLASKDQNAGNTKPTGSVTMQPEKDKTPQTGDDFNRGGYVALFMAGAAAFGSLAFFAGRKK